MEPFEINMYKLGDINWEENTVPIRVGITPYFKNKNGKLSFCFGIDRSSGDISDFSGRVERDINENPIDASIRELVEESEGIFGKFTKDQLQNSIVAFSKEMMIIFVHIIFEDSIEDRISLFRDIISKDEENDSEMIDVLELSLKDLTDIVITKDKNSPKMYHILSDFLFECFNKEFYSYL